MSDQDDRASDQVDKASKGSGDEEREETPAESKTDEDHESAPPS